MAVLTATAAIATTISVPNTAYVDLGAGPETVTVSGYSIEYIISPYQPITSARGVALFPGDPAVPVPTGYHMWGKASGDNASTATATAGIIPATTFAPPNSIAVRSVIGAAASGANTDISSLLAPFVFVGADGTTQFAILYSPGAQEYMTFQGSQAGGGGSLNCISSIISANVNCNITALNNGVINFSDGWGTNLSVQSAHTNQVTAKGVITGGAAGASADFSSSAYGTLPTIGGSVPVVASNAMTLYPLNVNGDFAYDQVKLGAVNNTTFGLAVDGWRATASQASKIQFQRVSATINGHAPYAEAVTTVTGSYTPLAADSFSITTNLTGADAGNLYEGTSSALPLTIDLCLSASGITAPYTVPVYLNNNNAGSAFQSYVHKVTMSSLALTCTTFTVPGDASGSWYGQSYPDYPGLKIGIDFGSGSNFSTATLDSWQAGQYQTTSGATTLVGSAPGSWIKVASFHVRQGSWSAPYIPLPADLEFQRVRSRYYSTFARRTAPAQNVGINTGEWQWAAKVAGTGANIVTVPLPNFTLDGQAGTFGETFYNPAAANGNCRDETLSLDGGVPTVIAYTSYSITFSCTGNASTVVGDRMGIHFTADSGL